MHEPIGAARIYQFVSVRILLLSKLKQETSMLQSTASLQKKWRKKCFPYQISQLAKAVLLALISPATS